MPIVHELNITNWTDESNTVPVPQWSVDVEVKWTDDAGDDHLHQQNYLFPNVLSGVPLKRLRHYMKEIIQQEVYVALGIWDGEV